MSSSRASTNSRPLSSMCPRSPTVIIPSAISRRRGIVGVAVEHQVAADEDPADLAGRHRPAALVEQHDPRVRNRPADGSRRLEHVLGARDRGERHLGRAIEVVEDRAERVHERASELGLERGAARDHGAQGARVVAPPGLGRQLHDALQHHRHHRHRGHPVALDQLEHPLGVEPRRQHDRAAERRGDDELPVAVRVEERRRDQHRRARVQRNDPQEPRERVEARRGGPSRAPFGVPVVPEVRITVRPSSSGGSGGCDGPVVASRS